MPYSSMSSQIPNLVISVVICFVMYWIIKSIRAAQNAQKIPIGANEPMSDRELSPEDRENLRAFLKDLRDHYESYHARKENSIWAATTIYVTGVFTLLVNIANKAAFIPSIVFSLHLVAIMYLIRKFIERQYSNRDFAARLVEACGILLSNLANPQNKFHYSDMQSATYEFEGNRQEYILPAVLCKCMKPKPENLKRDEKRKRNWDKEATQGIITLSTWIYVGVTIWSSNSPIQLPKQLEGQALVCLIVIAVILVGLLSFRPATRWL